MSRAAWDGLPAALKRVRGGRRYVVDPATGGDPVRVQLREHTPTPPHRPTVAEVALLLSALTRDVTGELS